MTTTPLDALATLETMAADGRLAAFCGEHGIGLLVAFGSAVAVRDGDVDLAPRDLDLAVSGAHDVVGVTSALVGLVGLDAVDVMDLDRAGIVARASVFERGLPLHEDDPGRFSREAMRALGMAADTAWVRDLQLDRLTS
ncbi:MAG: hypothetical protein ACLGIR_14515 [Actinomycetes bacterium]